MVYLIFIAKKVKLAIKSEVAHMIFFSRVSYQYSTLFLARDIDISPNPNPFNFWTAESEYIKKTEIRIHFFKIAK